jgi:hypothetical protein
LVSDDVLAPLLGEITDVTDQEGSFKVESGHKFYLVCWVTLGLGLRNHPGFRSWLRKVRTGLLTQTAEILPASFGEILLPMDLDVFYQKVLVIIPLKSLTDTGDHFEVTL